MMKFLPQNPKIENTLLRHAVEMTLAATTGILIMIHQTLWGRD